MEVEKKPKQRKKVPKREEIVIPKLSLIDSLTMANPKVEMVFAFCSENPLKFDIKGHEQEYLSGLQKSYEMLFQHKKDYSKLCEESLSATRAFYYCFGFTFPNDPNLKNKTFVCYRPYAILVGDTHPQDFEHWLYDNESEVIEAITRVTHKHIPAPHKKAIFNTFDLLQSGSFIDVCDTLATWAKLHMKDCMAQTFTDEALVQQNNNLRLIMRQEFAAMEKRENAGKAKKE